MASRAVKVSLLIVVAFQGSEGMSRMFNLSEQGLNMDGKFDDMLESLRQQLPGGSFSLGGTREGR